MCQSVCLSVSLSLCLSVSLSLCVSVSLCVCVSVCVSACLSVCLSLCLSVSLFVSLSVSLSVSLYVCLCVGWGVGVTALLRRQKAAAKHAASDRVPLLHGTDTFVGRKEDNEDRATSIGGAEDNDHAGTAFELDFGKWFGVYDGHGGQVISLSLFLSLSV